MKCKKAERLLLRSFDGLLKNGEREELHKHLKSCLSCQSKREHYQLMFDALKERDFPEPRPYFWERLQAKLKESKTYEPWLLWKQWGMKAIPLSLVLIVLLTTVLIFSFLHRSEELSQSGMLLFQNSNPIQETKALLEAEKTEDRSMMIIFTSLEGKNDSKRYSP
jgi:hypothetical protein